MRWRILARQLSLSMSFCKSCLETLLQSLYIALLIFVVATTKLHAAECDLVNFDVSAATADKALNELAKQADLKLLYRYDVVKQHQTTGLTGQFIVEDAVQLLLQRTGLKVVFKDENTLLIKNDNNDKEPVMAKSRCSNKYPHLYKGLVSIAIGSTALTPQLQAQENTATSSFMEEVVVSARKKAVGESVQDTPMAVSAYGERQFKAVFADNLSDLGKLAPNVEMKPASNVGVQNFTIRGMGVSGTTPSDSPAVGVFQNGMFWGTNYGSLLDTFDIESVEILRGPQGTLFGRNVTGGAVVVKTKRPTQEFGFSAEAQLGSYGRKDFSAAVEGGLSDTLAARLVVLDRGYDGYYTNTVTGKDYGRSETTLIRASLLFSPSESFDATLILEDYDETGHSVAAIGIEVPGNLPYTEVGFRQPNDWWDIRLDNPGEAENEVGSAVLEINWVLSHGTMTSITGYRDVLVNHYTDFDGSEYSGFNRALYMDQDQLSEELRFASSFSDQYEFTLGAYYFQQEQNYREGRDLGTSGVPHNLNFAAGSHLDQRSWALFGELDINITETLTATLGGRYTSETIEAQTVPFGSCPLNSSLPPLVRIRDFSLFCDLGPTDKESWSDFSPKLGVSWAPSDNQLLYSTLTKGFRSGGFSMRGNNLLPPFDSEEVLAFDAGYKTDLLDNSLRINAAVFFNDYSDLQRTVMVPDGASGVTQSTGNAAEATIQGLELELTYQALESLVFTLSYGYTDASFDEYLGFDVDGVVGITAADAAIAKNLDFTRVPKNTYSGSINYTSELGSAGDIDWRLAFNRTDKIYFDDKNTIEEPAYTVWDASASYRSYEQQWEISVFAKNLTNEEYAYWGSNLGTLGENRFAGAPRTVGLRVGYEY